MIKLVADHLSILLYHKVGGPLGSLGSGGGLLVAARLDELPYHIDVLHLLGGQGIAVAILQNGTSVNGDGDLLVGILRIDTDGIGIGIGILSMGRYICKTVIRSAPAYGGVHTWGHVIRFKGMGLTLCGLES